MKSSIYISISLVLATLPCVAGTIASNDAKDLTQYVNPLIGTAGFGNVYPGAQTPFGGIQISPDTDYDDYDTAAGYKYDHPTVLG
ncbi:MAG: glycoside hydrolase family 92 protein, partial [Muribaculaceae bacterium]|nr:glycoside hydrolase family 92 protein [Muribaculaceae bacterium]